MSKDKQESGLIRPLNVKTKNYAKKFRKEQPGHIVISINTLTGEGLTYADVRETMNRLMEPVRHFILNDTVDPLGIRLNAPCPIVNTLCCAHPHVLTPDVESFLTPEQRAWMVNGRYHQVGFYHESGMWIEEQVHVGTGIAMTLLDWWHSKTKSLDPNDHLPAQFSPTVAAHHNDLAGDLYLDDIAIWHESLVRLRNEILVVVRAADTGINVIDALAEFRESGRESFLW